MQEKTQGYTEKAKNPERLPTFMEIDNSMDKLERVSMDFSKFIESLKSRDVIESEDPPKESPIFSQVYKNLPGKIDELSDRFKMHLDMLRELIN